jgi:hypothetical protein
MEISFARHQFPPDIIRHAVWLYLRFTLSFRDVEDLPAERGLDVSYETVRHWVLKFGPVFARELHRRRPRPTAKSERERWRTNEDVFRRHVQHFLGVAVGDDEQVAMKIRGRLKFARGPRGKARQRHVVAAGFDRFEAHRFIQRNAIELSVVIRRPVEATTFFRKALSLAEATSSSISRVSQSASEISALSTIFLSSPVLSIGIVLTTQAPAFVAASEQATVAGLLAERISTRVPGSTPYSSVSAWAMRLVQSASSL